MPTLYFSKMSVANGFQDHQDEKVKNCIASFFSKVERNRDEFEQQITEAERIARQFELSLDQTPHTYSEYFQWISTYADVFERQFPMSRIDHYYFLYGRKMAEILSNIGLVESFSELYLESERALDMQSRIEKCIKDTEFIFFKLVASAALLSSEPRHSFFNHNYKTLSAEFEQFREAANNLEGMDHLKNLVTQASIFSEKVRSGTLSCSNQLKELQL